jgi:hypothetical protein
MFCTRKIARFRIFELAWAKLACSVLFSKPMRQAGSLLFASFVIVSCAPDYQATPTPEKKPPSTLIGGCTSQTCMGEKSLCTLQGGATVCTCPLGSHEEGASCKKDSVCAGDGSSCSQHGTCAETKSGGLACLCDAANGYAGVSCNECLIALGFHKSADAKTCTRDACDIAPSPCAMNPDPKRQRCTSAGGATTCNCDDGYVLNAQGTCVIPQGCDGRNTCTGKGNCSVVAGKVSCACDPGYAGSLCTSCAAGYFAKGDGTCFANPCASNPCAGAPNTLCQVDASAPANYRCDCKFGDGFSMSGGACVCAPDAIECTRDIIDAGRCVHPANVSAACTDGDANVCTTGVCNGAGQCAATAVSNGAACGGDACNPYVCISGTCSYGGAQCNPGGGGDGDGGGP